MEQDNNNEKIINVLEEIEKDLKAIEKDLFYSKGHFENISKELSNMSDGIACY